MKETYFVFTKVSKMLNQGKAYDDLNQTLINLDKLRQT